MASDLFTRCKPNIADGLKANLGLTALFLSRLCGCFVVTSGIAWIALTFVSSADCWASSGFDEAMRNLAQKQYQAAAAGFLQVLKEEPTNSRAAYYAASASYSALNTRQGISPLLVCGEALSEFA